MPNEYMDTLLKAMTCAYPVPFNVQTGIPRTACHLICKPKDQKRAQASVSTLANVEQSVRVNLTWGESVSQESYVDNVPVHTVEVNISEF